MAEVKAGPVLPADVDPATADVRRRRLRLRRRAGAHPRRPAGHHAQGAQHRRPPVQVGSHFHFFEVNRALEFDRAAAFGQHLAIPASTALRFEPGDEREVRLVPYGGKRAVFGFNNLVDGPTAGKAGAGAQGESRRARGPSAASARGLDREHPMAKLSRTEYVGLFGPTTGDRMRLGDTGLFVEIERDLRGPCGDEVVFGGGKSLREGMGMDNRLTYAAGTPDLVITNVTIIDAVQGVLKADVGIKRRPHLRHRQVRQPEHHGRHHAGP